MQWTPGVNAGFSPAHVRPWLPVADDAEERNVAVHSGDASSMLELYRQLLRLRREEPALAVGSYARVSSDGDVYAYRRQLQERELLVVLNLGGEQQDVDLGQSLSSGHLLLSTDPRRGSETVGGPMRLNANEGVVIGVAG